MTFLKGFSRGIILLFLPLLLVPSYVQAAGEATKEVTAEQKKIAYLVSDLRIPFWDVMAKGVQQQAKVSGYQVDVYSADNSAKAELTNLAKAIRDEVDGIVVSPTNSSACVTILKLAEKAGIPVVISDIGSDGGNYVSYISSDNREGAYQIGKVLTHTLQNKGWQDGRVGIIAIPQKRLNGQARTAGFMRALDEAGIKGADIKQQVDFSYEETYGYSRELIVDYPDLRALWLQGSDRYQGALDAIRDMGKKDEILLIVFDAEPEFLQLIPQGVLVGAAMQQPYLMGEQAVSTLARFLQGEMVEKNQQLSILAISAENIEQRLQLIRRNVLGLTDKR